MTKSSYITEFGYTFETNAEVLCIAGFGFAYYYSGEIYIQMPDYMWN